MGFKLFDKVYIGLVLFVRLFVEIPDKLFLTFRSTPKRIGLLSLVIEIYFFYS